MNIISSLFKKPFFTKHRISDPPIYIVSGLPRSGTSMMMKMLEAGGMSILTDRERAADNDNPRGYYEFERVKQLKEGDVDWLEEAKGKVVKVVSPLLEYLPPEHSYQIIFMRRNLDEILASQRRMLINRGEPTDRTSDSDMAALYQKHLRQVQAWLANHSHVDIDYRAVIEDPAQQAERLSNFLGDNMIDTDPMLAVIDPDLYRQRSPNIKTQPRSF